MDGVACAMFLDFIAVVAEAMIEKNSTHVSQKGSSSEKRAVHSEQRNFIIKRFYRQCLENILIGSKPFF